MVHIYCGCEHNNSRKNDTIIGKYTNQFAAANNGQWKEVFPSFSLFFTSQIFDMYL